MDLHPGFRLITSAYKQFCSTTKPKKIPSRIQFFKTIEGFRKVKKLDNSETSIVGTLSGYFSKHFSRGDYDVLLRENGTRYSNILAKYCGCKNFEDFQKYSSPQDLTIDDIDKVMKDMKIKFAVEFPGEVPEHFVSDAYYENLEFYGKDVEISCISYTLYWASHYFERIRKSSNTFRYILTEKSDVNKLGKFLYENPHLEQTGKISYRVIPEDFRLHEEMLGLIPFPIINDIVIYKTPDEKNGSRFRGIIGIKPHTNTSDASPKNDGEKTQGFSIKIDERAEKIWLWFEKMWAILDPKKKS